MASSQWATEGAAPSTDSRPVRWLLDHTGGVRDYVASVTRRCMAPAGTVPRVDPRGSWPGASTSPLGCATPSPPERAAEAVRTRSPSPERRNQ
jgi:hypothetical protein